MGEPPCHPVLPMLAFYSCLINDTPRSKKKKKYLVSSNYKHLLHTFCWSEIWATSSASDSEVCFRVLNIHWQAVFIKIPEGAKKGRQFTFMLPDVVTGKSLFFFLPAQIPWFRKNDQKKTGESENICIQAGNHSFFCSHLRIDISSLFCICWLPGSE